MSFRGHPCSRRLAFFYWFE